MRPVRRGASPIPQDFPNYADAQPYLISRVGLYCSYCERRIATSLAVEHIFPKGVPAFANLIGRWENFLLACVNCNATKSTKVLQTADTLLPDRDNTFAAFQYGPDGSIVPSPLAVATNRSQAAQAILSLTGIDKKSAQVIDENGKQIAVDRLSQRLEAWALAEEAKLDVDGSNSPDVRKWAVKTAKESGFFSIWMTVFAADPDMRMRLIDAFPGTSDSGCFNSNTGADIYPHPNADGLAHGGKI